MLHLSQLLVLQTRIAGLYTKTYFDKHSPPSTLYAQNSQRSYLIRISFLSTVIYSNGCNFTFFTIFKSYKNFTEQNFFPLNQEVFVQFLYSFCIVFVYFLYIFCIIFVQFLFIFCIVLVNDNKSDINNVRSFGDGMRDLYEKGVLRNDFILVSGEILVKSDWTSPLPLRSFLNRNRSCNYLFLLTWNRVCIFA